jgi:RND family efflux transporter MFP subunit
MNFRVSNRFKYATVSARMLNRYLVATAAVGLLLPTGCRHREEASPNRSAVGAADSEARVVRGAVAIEKQIERTAVANGLLVSHDQATLSVKVAGRIEEIPVDVGTMLKKGDVIAQTQRRDSELKVAQAKAALAAARARVGLPLDGTDDNIDLKEASGVKEAKAQLDEQAKNRARLLRLHEEKVLSESDLESAEAAYQVALNKYEDALQETNNRKALLAQRRAELNIAEQELADTEIRAPFNGVIQERKASPGEYLMEGAPLVTLVRVDPIRLRLEVAERESYAIRAGQKVRFKVDGDTNLYTGQIDRLSPAITEDNRMLRVEADIPNDGRLRPGAFARGEIVVNENALAIMVPRNAIVTFAGIEKVFVVENGKAAERRVTTGRARGDEIEIVKGLKRDETVILDPGAMRTGQPVAVGKGTTETANPPASKPAEAKTNG